MRKIEIKIDYFSVTFPLSLDDNDSVREQVIDMVTYIAKFLNIESHEVMQAKYAQNNFNYQYILGDYIILRLDGPMNENYQKTCHLEMKGEACRDYERRNKDKSWLELIIFMAELNAKFKRIDIAIDDFSGDDITLGFLQEKLEKGFYTSIFRSDPEPHGTLKTGLTLQFGTHASQTELVIYDKLQEQKKRRKNVAEKYWVRYEMRFRSDTADRIIFYLCRDYTIGNKFNLTKFAYQQLYRILDIKTDNSYSIHNQSQAKTDKRWLKFLNEVEKGTLPKILEKDIEQTFFDYFKNITPYIEAGLLALYIINGEDPYIFELEIYRFLHDNLNISRTRMKKLNMLLATLGVKPLDDIALTKLNNQFARIIEDKELPF